MSASLPCAKLLADLEGARRFLLERVADVSEREARVIPPGFKNNLHWHLGHLLYVQSSALYIRAGDPSSIPKAYRDYFGNGTTPATYDSLVPDWDEIRGRARGFSSDLVAKHESRCQKPLKKPLKLMHIEAGTVGEAIPFLLVHEGDHLCRVKQILARLSASP
jgi:hypothetical protein